MNGKTIVLVHGFNVSDGGKETILRLAEPLREAGHVVIPCKYGWLGVFGVRFCNKNIAHALASMAPANSVAIGHSNGCALIHAAAHMGAPFSRVMYINPALDNDAELAPMIDRADIYYDPGDIIAGASRWRPWSSWGNMGRVGYKGRDPRNHNHNLHHDAELGTEHHSEAFKDPEFLIRLTADLELN